MNEWLGIFERTVVFLFWTSLALALVMFGTVVIERLTYGIVGLRDARLRSRYVPLIKAALAGDEQARLALVSSPSSHHRALAWLLILPLIDNREPEHITKTRHLADALSLAPMADRLLHSRWWWRRARALRALGLLQYSDYTAVIVAALDDPNPDVRAAALDALADLKDPRSLPSIIVRVHDVSLYRGRRAQALTAFGALCEPLILELAAVDHDNRLTYALVLSRCGTTRSRAILHRWATDELAEVRTAAFDGLARIGLDEDGARLTLQALNRDDVPVRAMAAQALRHWGTSDATAMLARHLDDDWPVAVQAAHSLRSMQKTGLAVLEAQATRTDLAGLLARQMLWEESMRC